MTEIRVHESIGDIVHLVLTGENYRIETGVDGRIRLEPLPMNGTEVWVNPMELIKDFHWGIAAVCKTCFREDPK